MELAIFPQRLRNHVDLEEKDDDGWKNVAGGEGGKKVSIPFLLFSFSLLLDLDAKSRSKREKGGEMRYRCSQSRFSSLLFSFLFFFFPLLDFTQSQEVEKRGRERERNNVINVQSKFFIARRYAIGSRSRGGQEIIL